MADLDAALTRTVDRTYDVAIEDAARIVDRLRAAEMERLGLIVALGVDSSASEAVAATLEAAAAAIRGRLAKGVAE